MDFLLLTGLHKELELCYQQWPLVPICLLGEYGRIWVSLSWDLNHPYWLRFWVLLGGGAGYLPPPSRKDTGQAWGCHGWNIWGIPTHGLDTEWAQLKDVKEFLPNRKILGGGLAERCQKNCPTSGKVLGRGAQLGKKSRNTRGSAERYIGRSVVGDWMVLAEWLRGWSDTSSIWLPSENLSG